MSSGSLGFVGFIRARLWLRRVYSGSLGSFRRAVGVAGFISVRWVHSSATWWSLGGWTGSFRIVGFIWARSGGHLGALLGSSVHSG